MPRDVVTWLLDSDPALRWQVERDIVGEPPAVWEATRARVPEEGFGARLLALQDDDGQWAGGAYFPREVREGTYDEPGQPWTATTWSLKALREWGVDADVLAGTVEKLEANSRWEYEDLPYWGGEVDACINGYTLANGAWLGADVSGIVDWFLEHQMDEGGWNCDWVEGSTRASVHSTLNAIEGILYYESAVGGPTELRDARHRAEEYLLERHLTRRLTTGEHFGPWVSQLRYPLRWRYSALKALDHFGQASLLEGTVPDERVAEAAELVRAARRPDGRWLQGPVEVGSTWFEVDAPEGEPSKWVTFLALRALAWYDSASDSQTDQY